MNAEMIVLLGGGGHARVLIELIRNAGDYKIIGILDPHLEMDSLISNIPVLGNDNELDKLISNGIQNACIAVGSISDNKKREQLYEDVKRTGMYVPSLIHPQAIVSENAEISEGVQIMAGSVIQTGCNFDENSIINTGAIVEHDSKIGKHVHIGPRAVLSGGCSVDEGVFIGAGSTIIQGVKLGRRSVIGAGSVVINDIKEGTTVKGVPAR